MSKKPNPYYVGSEPAKRIPPAPPNNKAKRLAKQAVADTARAEPAIPRSIKMMDQSELKEEERLLSETLRRERAEMGRASFWFFLTHILFPKIWQIHYSPSFHREMCDELEALAPGEDSWWFIPRKRRKTYVRIFAYALWLIVRNPDIRILLVGAREKTVKPWSILIRDTLIPGNLQFKVFQDTYPEILLDKSKQRTALEFTTPARTSALADPTFRATYVGVTGAGWRCDVLMMDDVVERRNVTGPEMSLKVLTQIMDFIPLLDDTGDYRNIIGNGTRWAFHDPYGILLGETAEEDADEEVAEARERLEQGKLRVVVRHGLEDPDRPCEHCPEHVTALYPHGHPTMGGDGESCDPEIHSVEDVMEDYRRYLSNPNLGESLFWHQIMNVCLAPSDRKFQPEWFLDLDRPSWAAPKRKILVVDSADKDFQRAGQGDWMVALFGEYDDDGRLLLKHGLRSNKWTRDEFIRHIISYCTSLNWWPGYAVKEKFGEDTFLTDLGNAFNDAFHPVYPMAFVRPGHQKKLDWIVETLQAPMEQSLILYGSLFPLPIRRRAEYEACNLGQVKNEDVIDAMTLFFVAKIRVMPNKARSLIDTTWRPPNLGLYTLEGQPQAALPTPDPSPMDALTGRGGTLVIGLDQQPNQGEWRPPAVGDRMQINLNEPGTGSFKGRTTIKLG